MSDSPDWLAQSIARSARAELSAQVGALTTLVRDLAAITHLRHPAEFEGMLRSRRLELQALQTRRLRPLYRGHTQAARIAVALLEEAPVRAADLQPRP